MHCKHVVFSHCYRLNHLHIKLEWCHMSATAFQLTCNSTAWLTAFLSDKNLIEQSSTLLWAESVGDRVPLTKGQWCGKRFHAMTSCWEPWHSLLRRPQLQPQAMPCAHALVKDTARAPLMVRLCTMVNTILLWPLAMHLLSLHWYMLVLSGAYVYL